MERYDKVGRYEFLAEPFHCDATQHLFMGNLGNHLLNAADFHSNDRGFGMTYLNPIHRTWVLSRLTIELEEMPKIYDHFCVETWVESALRFFTNRNFKIGHADSEKVYGYGRSVWAMIDTDTRQPVDLLAIHDGAIRNYVDAEKPCPIEKPSRVKMSDDAPFVGAIATHYHDVDINGHVNSIKYIEHVLDLWSVEWYRSHRLQRFEIAYVAEAHQGDRLSFYREETEPGVYCIRIVKDPLVVSEGGATEPVEVGRSKVKFVKD